MCILPPVSAAAQPGPATPARCLAPAQRQQLALDALAGHPVRALAEGIYADRAYDRMPVLADALEDAGCDYAEILSHCRGNGPHVRGCWVLDALLGK